MTLNTQSSALQICIDIIGTQAETARVLNQKSRSNVNNWLKTGLPASQALPLWKATLAAAVAKGVGTSKVPSLETLLSETPRSE